MEQQNNVAIQHQQLLHHSSNHAAVSSDSPNGDAVLARWLQSAGLQHLAAPLAAAALDHRLLPSLLMQVPSSPSPFFNWDSGMLAFILCHSTLPSPLLFRVHHPLCVCTASVWISTRFFCFLNYCFPSQGGQLLNPNCHGHFR